MKYSALLFDLDGTLTDSKLGITATISRVLLELGGVELQPEELVWCVGPSLRECFCRLLGEGDIVDRALERYCKYYEEGAMFNNRVFPGVAEALSDFHAMGFRLAVVTGKPVYLARAILEHFELSGYFEDVYGPEDDNSDCRKVHLLRVALASMNVHPSRCLYVGDHEGDVLGARENGIEMLAVRYGYGNYEKLKMAGASKFADAPSDWKRILEING